MFLSIQSRTRFCSLGDRSSRVAVSPWVHGIPFNKQLIIAIITSSPRADCSIRPNWFPLFWPCAVHSYFSIDHAVSSAIRTHEGYFLDRHSLWVYLNSRHVVCRFPNKSDMWRKAFFIERNIMIGKGSPHSTRHRF